MKRALILITGVLVVLSLLVVACAPKAAAPAPAASAKPAWEAKWEATEEAAKKEGTLVVWSGIAALRAPVAEAFSKKYGISAEFTVIASSAEARAKLFAERRAGLYNVDVELRGVSSPIIQLKPDGIVGPLEPILILPEVTNPKLWRGREIPFVDRDHMVIAFLSLAQPTLAINTNLVKPEEIQSYNDLLNPKWKGKIIVNDPTTPGGGSYLGLIADPLMGSWDYLRNLAKMEPVVMRDKRVQVEWLAHGKMAIAVMPPPDSLPEFLKAGAPIRIVRPKEGTFTSTGGGGIYSIDRAPHLNAATLFINWFLSKEGQTIVSKALGYPSARLDVPTDFLDPIFVPDPNVKYYNSANEDYAFRNAKDMKTQKEIFGHLVRK